MKQIFKRISTAFFIRIIAFIVLYPTAVLLARLLGAEQYGVYGVIVAIVNICLIIPVFGFDQLIVKSLGKYVNDDGVSSFDKTTVLLFSFCSNFVVLISAFLVLGMVFVFWNMGNSLLGYDSHYRMAICLGMFLIPIIALRKIYSSTLRATHQTLYAQVADEIIQPLLFFICIVSSFSLGFSPSILDIVISLIVAYIISLVFSIYCSRVKVSSLFQPASGKWKWRLWLSLGFPMMLLAGVHNLATYLDRIMVGMFLNTESVGYYLVAARNATLILIVSSVCCGVTNPIISREFSRKRIDKLQELISFQTLISVGSGFTFLVIFAVFSESILGLFGDEFIIAQSTLLVISVGYVTFMLFGGALEVLFMTGYQWMATRTVILSTLLNITLNILLIPIWGIVGAAIATAISETIKGGVAAYCANKHLGVNTTILGSLELLMGKVAKLVKVKAMKRGK